MGKHRRWAAWACMSAVSRELARIPERRHGELIRLARVNRCLSQLSVPGNGGLSGKPCVRRPADSEMRLLEDI